MKKVLITGAGGYVGAVLIPKLLDAGWEVRALDLYIFGEDVFGAHRQNSALTMIKGDLRNSSLVQEAVSGCDAVIHLACISNDPSFELDPGLGKSINFDAFAPLVDAAQAAGVERFIYASSSSVYGIKDDPDVTEDLPLEPLTDYSKYKALCEEVLTEKSQGQAMAPLIIRPATVCGYSPRQRLDLTVNILTHHAVVNGKIKVFGGNQKRPNIHIQDMTDLYLKALTWPADQIRGKVYNVGYENHTVRQIAEMVRAEVGEQVEIVTEPTDDHRSYRISSDKIKNELGFEPSHTIQDAVRDLVAAFREGLLPNSMTDDKYYNIRVMKEFQELDKA